MSVRDRIKWGATWGLYFGAAFSAQAGLVMLITRGQHEIFKKFPFAYVVGFYIVFALLAGAVVGLLRPLIRSGVSAALVAFVAIYPFTLFGIVLLSSGGFSRGALIDATVITIIWAAIGGPGFRKFLTDKHATKKRRT